MPRFFAISRRTLAAVIALSTVAAFWLPACKDAVDHSGPSKPVEAPLEDPSDWSTQQRAFRLATSISLAALGRAQGISDEAVQARYADALQLAGLLNVELPPLFQSTGDRARDGAEAMHYLLDIIGKRLGPALDKGHGDGHAAALELGVKSSLLYLLYEPGGAADSGSLTNLAVDATERSAIALELPLDVYSVPLSRIRSGVSYEEMKDQVKALHRSVFDALGSPQGSGDGTAR